MNPGEVFRPRNHRWVLRGNRAETFGVRLYAYAAYIQAVCIPTSLDSNVGLNQSVCVVGTSKTQQIETLIIEVQK